MISKLASRISQQISTAPSIPVSHEAALEVIADIEIIDTFLGSAVRVQDQLITALLPLLEGIVLRNNQKEGESVVDALCRLCTTILGLPFASTYTHISKILVASYTKTGYASPVKAISVVLTSISKGKDAPPTSSLSTLEQVLLQVAEFTLGNLNSLGSTTLGTFFWAIACTVQVCRYVIAAIE